MASSGLWTHRARQDPGSPGETALEAETLGPQICVLLQMVAIMLHYFQASVWHLAASRIFKSLKEYFLWKGGEENLKPRGIDYIQRIILVLSLRHCQALF